MQYENTMSNRSTRKKFVDSAVLFFINELKLNKSTWKLLVSSQKNLAIEESWTGAICSPAPGLAVLFLDSKMPLDKLLLTIAHEMVHVKQYALGQLRYQQKGNKTVPVWLGHYVKEDSYYDLPWELQAFGRERLLANKFVQTIGCDC